MRQMVLLLVMALVAETGLAQQGTSDLRGRLMDVSGAVLPGVGVTLRNQDTGNVRETISGEDGAYFFGGMTPGRYQIDAELPGFKKYQRTELRLEVGKTATVDITLEVGTVNEAVTVTEQAPIIDTTSKEIGGYIQSREIMDLPSGNRNFTGYLSLMPGVVASISTDSFGADSVAVNGQGVQNTNYALDGAANNDGFNAGNGGAQARTPIEAVQEFQFLTSQFDAEFGGSSGGIVNAVSKQGSNNFHGSAFGFFKDSSLTAKSYFVRTLNLEKPQTKEQQYGGTIGGPIMRDKMHFFGSLERVLQDNGVSVNIPARPDLNSSETERTRVWNHLIRFDHQINQAHTWSVRWLQETSPQFNQSATSQTRAASEEENDLDYSVVANLTSVLSPRTINTLRTFTTREDVLFGNTGFFAGGRKQEELLPTLSFLGFTHQQSSRANRRLDEAIGVDETFAWFLPDKMGSHDLKFGAQYNWTGLRTQNWGNLNGTFTFPGTADFNRADPRTYPERFSIRVPAAQDFLLKVHFFSWFAQDKWKLSNRATLSAGLRYDLEVVPLLEKDNPEFAGDPTKYPVDKNNYSPRVGITYALDSNLRTVVRGGYGLFFQRTPLTFLTAIIGNAVFSDSFTATFPVNGVDDGPSQGLLPTNPFLVNGPTVNRALLNSMFPAGTIQKTAGAVRFDNPDRRLSKSHQLSAGIERQFGDNMSISADYVHSANRDQLMLKDLNPGLRRTTARTATLDRRDPNFVAILQPVNVGEFDYDSLQVQVEKRYNANYGFRMAYTLAKGFGNTAQGQNDQIDTQLGDDLRLEMNEGPTSNDRRHNLVLSGSFQVPRTGGLKLSAVAHALSGTPFSITDDTTDPDRNGQTGNDWLPAGTYSGSATNQDAITVEYEGGRGGARGPGVFQLDFRGGYRFNVAEQKTLEVFTEVLNLTNKSNFTNPNGNRRNANFLILTGLRGNGPTRTAQFGLRFAF